MSELEKRLSAGTPTGSATPWTEVRARVLARADGTGLLDLAYEDHETPFGRVRIVASEQGIVRIALGTEPGAAVLDDLGRRISPRIGRISREEISAARGQLDRYFAGDLTRFDLPLDWRLVRGFRLEVLKQTVRIPYGTTASYSEVAERAGSPRAVRAAGSALANNPLPIVVPCHRVLRSDGLVGAYLGGSAMKQALLDLERAD